MVDRIESENAVPVALAHRAERCERALVGVSNERVGGESGAGPNQTPRLRAMTMS